MDAVTFISHSLAQVHIRLLGTCEGLTQEQVIWRPAAHANNIGFIIWHVARGEDRTITSLARRRTGLWESDGWYREFGQAVEAPEPDDRPGLRSLAVPGIDVLVGYIEAAYRQTREYLSDLSPEDLDAVPDASTPERTVGSMLRHLITHKNNHHGQIDYLRGLQDEGWDLPRGTGVVLPPQ
jgi:uncharacterized damage-inducible protein DinB